jgi:hypothetical protein
MSDTRVTFVIVGDTVVRLDEMMRRTRSAGIAALMTQALRHYEWVLDERDAGNLVGSLDHEMRFTAIKE